MEKIFMQKIEKVFVFKRDGRSNFLSKSNIFASKVNERRQPKSEDLYLFVFCPSLSFLTKIFSIKLTLKNCIC